MINCFHLSFFSGKLWNYNQIIHTFLFIDQKLIIHRVYFSVTFLFYIVKSPNPNIQITIKTYHNLKGTLKFMGNDEKKVSFSLDYSGYI